MPSEPDRLRQLYTETSDEHLQDLAEEPDELTLGARVALDAELRRRNLEPLSSRAPSQDHEAPPATPATDDTERSYAFGAGIPGIVPAAGAPVETALEPSGEVQAGMVTLAPFYDGIELRRACETLEAARIPFAIQEIAGDAAMGSPTRFELWTEPSALDRAQEILHRDLGLFPEPETGGMGENLDPASASDPASKLVVAQFESASEAEQVRTLLADQGFAAESEADSETSAYTVLVPAAQQDAALELLAARLGLS